jgi:hypothetical protein
LPWRAIGLCFNERVIGLNQNLKADETNRFIVSPILATSFTRPSPFIHAENKTMNTKIKSVALLGLSLIGLLALAACKSTTTVTTDPFGNSVTNVTKTIDTVRVATISRQAATVGTSEVLASHPEWRPQFQLAADNLRQLATSPSISLDSLLAIAQQLPVKELKSQAARLSFEGATLLISAIDVPELPADRLAQLQPIAQAIADGINAGLPPLPVKTN